MSFDYEDFDLSPPEAHNLFSSNSYHPPAGFGGWTGSTRDALQPNQLTAAALPNRPISSQDQLSPPSADMIKGSY